MKSRLSAWILRLFGWKVVMEQRPLPAKYVLIAIPHTSNWDFPLGVLTRAVMNEDVGFVAKDSLFWWPLGPIMRWLKGYAVNRKQRTNFVESVAKLAKDNEEFKICIAPEGTRDKVQELKTGFYYIALEANIPIVLCRFDYGIRTVGISKPFYPTGNKEADFAVIDAYFKGVRGFYPEKSYGYGR